ncbi:MAG: hypothetical protein HY788_22485 [Deltaproteobacteria bacterium]|nr:hypothetical protein [Deltaproteobacteria bacterium]
MASGTHSRRGGHQPELDGRTEFMARMYRVLIVGFALMVAAAILNAVGG